MSLKDDVARLVPPPPPINRLSPAVAPDAIREQTGLERKQAGKVDSEEVTVESTDGLFTFTVRVVKA
jgi:hypothetical protein